jgi:hypothetical protein
MLTHNWTPSLLKHVLGIDDIPSYLHPLETIGGMLESAHTSLQKRFYASLPDSRFFEVIFGSLKSTMEIYAKEISKCYKSGFCYPPES